MITKPLLIIFLTFTITYAPALEKKIVLDKKAEAKFKTKADILYGVDAVKRLKKKLEKDPNNTKYQLNLADAYFLVEEFDQAKNAFIAFHKKWPTNALALKRLGQLKIHYKQYEQALDYFKKVDALSAQQQSDPYNKLNKAKALIGLKRFDEADSIMATAFKSSASIKLLLADFYFEQQYLDRAQKLYQEVLTESSNAPAPYYKLALINYQFKNFKKAANYFEEFLQKSEGKSLKIWQDPILKSQSYLREIDSKLKKK